MRPRVGRVIPALTPMAQECIHCGTRCDDAVTRCPNCLRSRLVAVEVAPTPAGGPRSRRWAVLGAAGVVLVAAGAFVAMRSTGSTGPGAAERSAPAALNAVDQGLDPLAVGEALAPLVTRAAAAPGGSARGRLVLEALSAQRRARVVDDLGEVPPPRTGELVWRVLPDPAGRVTELDLARLVVSVLRAAGEPGAAVVARNRPRRPDEPVDPTASLGAWAVSLGDQVLDVSTGLVLGSREVPSTPLSAPMLRAAIASQAALEVAPSPGGRAQALAYANAAVEAWSDGATPLAARARVWQEVGGSSGLDLADADLRAAIALRDDAGLHLARARVLLGQRRLIDAAQEARRAAQMSPGWGEAAVATLAFAPVYARLDAAAPAGCDALRAARAPWTDDASALCAPGSDPAARRAAAGRLLADRNDPLLMAYAGRFLGDAAVSTLQERVRPGQRREVGAWLQLLGAADLAAQLWAEDGGT